MSTGSRCLRCGGEHGSDAETEKVPLCLIPRTGFWEVSAPLRSAGHGHFQAACHSGAQRAIQMGNEGTTWECLLQIVSAWDTVTLST